MEEKLQNATLNKWIVDQKAKDEFHELQGKMRYVSLLWRNAWSTAQEEEYFTFCF